MSDGAAPSTSIGSGQKVTPTGNKGTDGSNSQTTTTANFTVPAVSSTVLVEVATSDIFNTSLPINIATAGPYYITAIPDPTHITARNVGGGAAPGSNILSGSQVIPTGEQGDQGVAGSVSATSDVVFTAEIAPPSTAVSEHRLFINSSGSRISIRAPSDGTTSPIAFMTEVGVIYSSASAPLTTDDSSAGYKPGDRWIHTTPGDIYALVDATPGLAVWKTTTAGASVPGEPRHLVLEDASALESELNSTSPNLITAQVSKSYVLPVGGEIVDGKPFRFVNEFSANTIDIKEAVAGPIIYTLSLGLNQRSVEVIFNGSQYVYWDLGGY